MSNNRSAYLSLMNVLTSEIPCSPGLPLMHCTKSEYFFDMISLRALAKRQCRVFNEELVYLFYGRPSYRPYRQEENTSLTAFRPVALIFRPDLDIPIKRIYPFDTGAFFDGLYAQYIPAHANLANFEIDPGLEHASRSVSLFFKSNKNYYRGRAVSAVAAPPTNLTISSLLGMFRAQGLSKVDDRKSAIEIQSSETIVLDAASVMAVCMPGDYCEDEGLYSLLTEAWGADIIEYDIYHDSPVHDIREVMARVKDYLETKGLL